MVIFFSNSSGWEINESCLSSNMKPTFSGSNKLQLNLQMELPCGYGGLSKLGNDLAVCHISNRISSNVFVPFLKAKFYFLHFFWSAGVKDFSVSL